MSGTKLTFSLKSKKKKSTAVAPAEGFDAAVDRPEEESIINPDIPRAPLVIPVQQDARQSLQEQARLRRDQQTEGGREEEKVAVKKEDDKPPEQDAQAVISKEDQAAISALQIEASGQATADVTKASKMVIEGSRNTFQSGGKSSQQDADKVQLNNDLEQLPQEVSVESSVYRQVRIADFGAAMLRGMGWQGSTNTNEKNNNDAMNLPRPSRLGLGATPKLLEDAPTHRRMRRQDQVQKAQRLKEQHAEFEKQRQEQVRLDKQQTIQDGSIVLVEGRRRAIIRQWQGVPGLNQILVQYEKDSSNVTKVKRGSVRLISRSDLESDPFSEPKYHEKKGPKETNYLGQQAQQQQRDNDKEEGRKHTKSRRDDDDHNVEDRRRRRRERDDRDGSRKDRDDEGDRRRKRRDDSRDRDGARRRDEDHHGRQRQRGDEDRDRKRRHRDHEDDRDYHDGRSRKHRRQDENDRDSGRGKRRRDEDIDNDRKPSRDHSSRHVSLSRPSTWLIPSIRVRVITSKLGKSYYKEKGVVMDVTVKGTATLNMTNGQVMQAPERYLETALPKVGGNACILAGDHKWAKGRLLERNSKTNRGAVQLFEDMTIVNISLDDMAEWCGPLDDDIME